jgi:hypothetical protein
MRSELWVWVWNFNGFLEKLRTHTHNNALHNGLLRVFLSLFFLLSLTLDGGEEQGTNKKKTKQKTFPIFICFASSHFSSLSKLAYDFQDVFISHTHTAVVAKFIPIINTHKTHKRLGCEEIHYLCLLAIQHMDPLAFEREPLVKHTTNLKLSPTL